MFPSYSPPIPCSPSSPSLLTVILHRTFASADSPSFPSPSFINSSPHPTYPPHLSSMYNRSSPPYSPLPFPPPVSSPMYQPTNQGFQSSSLTYDLGTGMVHFLVATFKLIVKLSASLTSFVVANPITRPAAWMWLEAIKHLSSFFLGASRGVVEVMIAMLQPQLVSY